MPSSPTMMIRLLGNRGREPHQVSDSRSGCQSVTGRGDDFTQVVGCDVRGHLTAPTRR